MLFHTAELLLVHDIAFIFETKAKLLDINCGLQVSDGK